MNCTLLNTSTLFGHVPSQRYIGIIILFYFSVWSIILIDWGGLYFIQLCDLKKSVDQEGDVWCPKCLPFICMACYFKGRDPNAGPIKRATRSEISTTT